MTAGRDDRLAVAIGSIGHQANTSATSRISAAPAASDCSAWTWSRLACLILASSECNSTARTRICCAASWSICLLRVPRPVGAINCPQGGEATGPRASLPGGKRFRGGREGRRGVRPPSLPRSVRRRSLTTNEGGQIRGRAQPTVQPIGQERGTGSITHGGGWARRFRSWERSRRRNRGGLSAGQPTPAASYRKCAPRFGACRAPRTTCPRTTRMGNSCSCRARLPAKRPSSCVGPSPCSNQAHWP